MSQEISIKINEDKRASSTSLCEVVEKIRLPFLIVKVPNYKDNKVKVCMTADQRSLAVTSQEKLDVAGDMDMLLKLGFHR